MKSKEQIEKRISDLIAELEDINSTIDKPKYSENTLNWGQAKLYIITELISELQEVLK